MITKILTAVLLVISVGMFVYLYGSVEEVIETRNAIITKELSVTQQLKLIRESEIVFLSVNGRYTANWDSLADFIENGKVPIIDRREEIIQKPYGGDEIKIHTDTIGFVSAKERIFKKNYTLSASDNGSFIRYRVKVGDPVLKAQKAVDIKGSDGSVKEQPFTEQGTITNLTALNAGDEVKKGQMLIAYSNYVFDINTDVRKIGFKPGTDTKFDIFVGKVDKAGVLVQVIEVKDPLPDNPIRKETNDQKIRRPLRFGSRVDITTAGNWE